MQPIDVRQDRLTRDEAEARAERVSDVAYAIDLEFEVGAKAFRGDTTVTFEHRGGALFLEWIGGRIERFEVNGAVTDPRWDGVRISLPADALADGRNEVRVVYERPYDHTGEGLHQFVDPADGNEYLYTQFEPYSAHRVFPCFDQPDIKATYTVSVTAPAGWRVVTSGRPAGTEQAADGRTRHLFAETAPFSTYLLAVCAGPFHVVTDEHEGIPLGLLCRASLAGHLDAEPLFDLTKRGLDFFSSFFDQPYPFGKYDQVFVPEFNWGGMENVATVTYTDTVVFRDPPTEDQLRRRAEYFMHEMAHMWFGDLVTLRWWSDLWLNESFASFVGYMALERVGWSAVWQDFNYRMKLWAYREDQRPTTHRIADDVPSTAETFLNFDGITYGKGASVLKQLVAAIGEDAFRDGMRTYFRRHRFGNASLADFLAALQEGSGIDLVHWAARWLKAPSLNTIAAEWEEEGGTITRFDLVQTAPEEHPVLRPHTLEVGLTSGGRTRAIPVAFDRDRHSVDDAVGLPAPDFVYPNVGDFAYAKVALDPVSLDWARRELGTIDDPLLRLQVWSSLWEMVRDGRWPSVDYLDLVRRVLVADADPTIVQMVAATATAAIGRYVPEDRIDAEAHRFVTAARKAIDLAPPGDMRVLWARALLRLAVTPEDARLAASLVDVPLPGLAVDQDMRWTVAIRWMALGLDGAAERLASEASRDDSDRGRRAVLTARAAAPDPAAKDDVWERLHNHGYDSLALAMAAAAGFWRRRQRAIVEPFVPRFFENLPGLFDEWEAEAARSYYRTFFPDYRIEASTREAVAGVLARPEVGPMLRRLLVETDDDLRRAITAREVAAAPAPPPAPAG